MIPNGMAVETDSGIYYIKGGRKYRAFSETVLRSWRFNVLPSEDSKLGSLKDGGVLGFRPGSLISNIADGKLYVVDGKYKRQIKNPHAFQAEFGGLPIYKASEAECDLHPTGDDFE